MHEDLMKLSLGASVLAVGGSMIASSERSDVSRWPSGRSTRWVFESAPASAPSEGSGPVELAASTAAGSNWTFAQPL